MYVCTYVHMFVHIYIYRERERVEKDAGYSGSGGLDSLKDKVDKHSASEC